ncbi:MAG: hypothetical protein U0992_11620 [Planctomycetaceae bacterium]
MTSPAPDDGRRSGPPAEDVASPVEPPPVVFDNRPEPPVEFATDIRPLLANHCYRCHGRTGRRPTAVWTCVLGLPCDGRLAATPIIAGDPAHSELLARITAEDPAVRNAAGRVAAVSGDVERLREWIEAGAEAGGRAALGVRETARGAAAENGGSRLVARRDRRVCLPVQRESIAWRRIRGRSRDDPAVVAGDLLGLLPTPEDVDELGGRRRAERGRAAGGSVAMHRRISVRNGRSAGWTQSGGMQIRTALSSTRRGQCGCIATG